MQGWLQECQCECLALSRRPENGKEGREEGKNEGGGNDLGEILGSKQELTNQR